MKYLVVVERGESSWGAHVPDLPGCVAAAPERDGVVRLIREAIALHIEALSQAGEPVPRAASEAELVEVRSS